MINVRGCEKWVLSPLYEPARPECQPFFFVEQKSPVLLNLIFMYFFNSKKRFNLFYDEPPHFPGGLQPFFAAAHMNHADQPAAAESESGARFIMSVYAGGAGP